MVLKLGHFRKQIKYLESFEMLCLKRIVKISWTEHVRNE